MDPDTSYYYYLVEGQVDIMRMEIPSCLFSKAERERDKLACILSERKPVQQTNNTMGLAWLRVPIADDGDLTESSRLDGESSMYNVSENLIIRICFMRDSIICLFF
jgi:hypothetical protein